MSLNIEIKAHYPDAALFKEKISHLDCRYEGLDEQTDTFFETPAGRLKLRESSLHGVFLIPYLRPDRQGPKISDYMLIKINDVQKVKELFTKILGVKAIVKKKRQIYHYQNVRIHYDQVEYAGSFIEFEAVIVDGEPLKENEDKINDLLKFFEIKKENLITGAYVDMM